MPANPLQSPAEITASSPSAPRPRSHILRALVHWYARWLQRQHLAELDDRMLRDIGMSREARRRECRKPF